MKILVINAGSSSMKFTLYSMENEQILAKGLFERLGYDKPNMVYKRPDGYKFEAEIPVKNHVEALKKICEKLVDPEDGVLKSLSEITAIGHRVLHGGEKITAPVKIDDKAKEIIRECFPLGPLHNPANLAGIEACEEEMPGVPNVGVFDTQFHMTMPPEAYLYAIPYDFYKKYGIRKYGFHGTSHHYVTLATAKFLNQKVEDTTIITCHLGNGCSMAAVKNGKVIDTTMGLTPLEGLMMGTRCGDLDPAAVIRLVDLGHTTAEVDKILNKQSGLYGVGDINSGDMRDMLAAAEKGSERAQDVRPPHREIHRRLLCAARRAAGDLLHRRRRGILGADAQAHHGPARFARPQAGRRPQRRMFRQSRRDLHRRQQLEGDRDADRRRTDDRAQRRRHAAPQVIF